MPHKSLLQIRWVTLTLVAFVVAGSRGTLAQDIPNVPNNIQFGGINVKFDNSARRLIETDIRSLMANKRFWDDKMDRAVLYFPIIESVLIEEEVPLDFKYLAVQESSLSADAVSTSNAVGFWQMKQETAQELGLRIDNQIDERKSINASTRAAARYLKRSNQQFNNWVSSLYSYYLGMGGISKLVPSDWAYAREVTLNGRTDPYVLRFFAHMIALEAGLERHRTANSIVLLEYPQGRGKSVDYIAKELNLNALDLQRYNLWLKSDQIPGDRDYVLVLPVANTQVNGVRERLLSSRQAPDMDYTQDDIGFPILRKASVQLKGRNDPVFYEINGLPGIQARPGDKADNLAKAAKISTSAFLKYNDLGSRDPLVPGEVYYLAKKNKKAMVPFHTVREGETIRSIGQIYGIQARELLSYNRISNRNQRLQTGRVMWLMKKRPASQPVEIIDQPGHKPYAEPQYKSSPEPQLIGTTQDIPQSPAERKKYTPKLADNTTVATNTKGSEETQPSRPEATYSNPKKSDDTPSRPPSQTPSRTSGGTSDRVVIISQEDSSSPNFDSEPVTPAKRTPSPATSSRDTAPRVSSGTSMGSASSSQYHTVESGQTYYSISRLYSIDIKDLLSWNNLTTNDRLAVGQRLVVNPSAGTASPTFRTPAPDRYSFHTVVAGETLFRISKNYGVSIEDIQQLNQMSDTNVKLGQKLKIPQN